MLGVEAAGLVEDGHIVPLVASVGVVEIHHQRQPFALDRPGVLYVLVFVASAAGLFQSRSRACRHMCRASQSRPSASPSLTTTADTPSCACAKLLSRAAETVRRCRHGEQLESALLTAGWDELVEVGYAP